MSGLPEALLAAIHGLHWRGGSMVVVEDLIRALHAAWPQVAAELAAQQPPPAGESPFDRVAADRLADAVAALIEAGMLPARGLVADALLDYRNPPQSEESRKMAVDLLAAPPADPQPGLRELLADVELEATLSGSPHTADRLTRVADRLRAILGPMAPPRSEGQ